MENGSAYRLDGLVNGEGAKWLLALVLILAMFVPVSCHKNDGTAAKQQRYAIDKTYRRGPVSFRIAADKKEMTIAEHLKLLLEVTAQEGYTARLPSFGEKLSSFGIVDYRDYPPSLEKDSTVVTRREYELEPFLSGEYQIPPMAVSFWQRGDTTTHKLESDTIRVQVLSLLPADKKNLEIKDIVSPLSFPSRWFLWFIAGGGAAVAALLVFLLIRGRKKREEKIPKLPAHELAFRRLEALIESGLLDEKRYREFTAKVADIMRYYIEDRFGLRAPERTTEEFFAEAKEGLDIDEDKRKMLEKFLTYCDLVKFAALEPTADDVKHTFDTCRDFVEATKIEGEVKGEAA